ncbi:DUF58 domain-containing protein [Psychroflexus sp. ALD_RP9]|uniref:DUF58 domain-containing protein n=1 Tax=Psychroflexus sp. ALD_RP9 TaxID=2777186 RepID=UPI001A8C873A|nr:DUF58 domain-containing protein [Psychroflexus sp. ALD_RP9]QSS96377.1 DUF58 domain-containing protein [Psychroflexus sp. ALD_RP9]
MSNFFEHYNLTEFQFLINRITEGFISGLHKSPFHGFSSEFAEHKQYISGQSTKNIDWKLYARTDKFYTKKYVDETNLRCYFILDISKSMYYPVEASRYNQKVGFSSICISVLMNILLKQRDAFGLSSFTDIINYSSNTKNTVTHYNLLLRYLEQNLLHPYESNHSTSYKINFEQIANTLPKRSVVVMFSDFLSNNPQDILDAFKYFKFKSHSLIVFNVLDFKTELNLNFLNSDTLNLYDLEYELNENIQIDKLKHLYKKEVLDYLHRIKDLANKQGFPFYSVDINQPIETFLRSYFVGKQIIKH